MSPREIACKDMMSDDAFHPILIGKEKDIIEFLNKDSDDTVISEDPEFVS